MAHVLLLPLQATRRTDSLALRPVRRSILLRGFQLYAVEKWLVDRSRPLTLLTVYTGLHDHILPVVAYTPIDPAAWDNVIFFLKRDGARQRLTEHGSIMVTSLAHFRSDYTIVHIPDGDFPAVSDYLYANINLLRMNCSGRSALTLEEPSDSTKDRFISTYLIPDVSPPDSRTRDRNIFTATVLELVKLIQAGLSLFGMYSGPLDGLLCDTTVEGIHRWIADIGEPIIGLEPTERIADPMFVSALLSLVLSIRNKLSALGYSQHVPKDPFLQPQTLSNALAAFVQNTSPFTGPPSSTNITPTSSLHGHFLPHLAHAHSLSMPSHPFHATLSPPPSPIVPRIIVLNQSLIEAIDSAYDNKHRPTETRKVRRVIKEKLDDLAGVVAGTAPENVSEQGTPDVVRRGNQSSLDIPGASDRIGSGSLAGSSTTLGGIASGLGLSGGASGLSSLVDPTVNLSRFVKLVVGGAHGTGHGWTRGKSRTGKQRESVDLGIYAYGKEKDKDKDAGSVRALWSGNIALLVKMREWQELSGVTTERDREPTRWRDRLAAGVLSEGEEGERGKVDGRTTEEESDQVAVGSFWGERMQRTLESWTTRRSRRRVSSSLDLTISPSKGSSGSKLVTARRNGVSSPSSLPLGPSQITIPPNSPIVSDDDDFFLSSGQVSPQASHFFVTPELPKIRNSTLSPLSPSRFRTPTRAAASIRDDVSDIGTGFEDAVNPPYSVCRDDTFVERRKNGLGCERRRSFHDLGSLQDMVILTPAQMRVDVELCGQMLIMTRRQEHLRDVISCLQVLESSLSTTSQLLREDYEAHHEFIVSLDPASVLSDINGEYKKAEEFSQQTNTLVYESEQFNINDLWQPVNHSRQQVFKLRDKVFGIDGRRLPHGVHGAHGQFNRLQWTLDGKPRLVDVYGKTQKEVEEEARADPRAEFSLPVTGEDEEDVVEHPSIKPMWLLRLFTRWGARWGAHPTVTQTEQHPVTNDQNFGTPSALGPKTDLAPLKVKSPSADKPSD